MSRLDDAMNEACDARSFASERQWNRAKQQIKDLAIEIINSESSEYDDNEVRQLLVALR